MKSPGMFSVAHLKAHADDLIDAVHGSHEIVVITRDGTPNVVLQDVNAFRSLQRAVGLLEKLANQHIEVLKSAQPEIESVLNQLRVTD